MRKSQSKTQLSLLFLALILSISFAYAASFSSSVANPPYTSMVVQAGAASQLFNFSVNKHIMENNELL